MIVETDNFSVIHPFSISFGKSVAKFIEDTRTKICKRFQFPTINWRNKCVISIYDNIEKWKNLKSKSTAFSDIEISKDSIIDTKIYLLVTQDIWTDKVPHEITHCSLAEFTKKNIIRCVDEGMACYVETKVKTDYYKGQCIKSKIDLTKLIDIKDYPEEKVFFYAHSYILVDTLICLKGMEVFNKFLVSLASNTFIKSLKDVYDSNIKALQNDVIARLKSS